MRTRIGFLNVSLLALFCVSTAVISGCSSPDGTDSGGTTFAPAGEWGLTYDPTFMMSTSYSNAGNQTVNPSISQIVGASGLPDAGGGYNEIAVFLYDPTANTVTVGQPNPATDGGGTEIPTTQIFTLNSNRQATITASGPTFSAITSTACGVTSTISDVLQFSADGSSFTITEAESFTFTDNSGASGLDCVDYLTQQQGDIQSSSAVTISSYVQEFSAFLSTGAINLADMPSLTSFNLSISITGTRVNTSTDVPAAAVEGRPSTSVKFQVTAKDARMAKMIQNLITGTQQK